MWREGKFEGEKGAAAALRFNECQERLELGAFAREAIGVALRELGNLFDRITYCNPNTNWSSGDFGKVFTQCNTPRSVQMGVRVDF